MLRGDSLALAGYRPSNEPSTYPPSTHSERSTRILLERKTETKDSERKLERKTETKDSEKVREKDRKRTWHPAHSHPHRHLRVIGHDMHLSRSAYTLLKLNYETKPES